MSRSPSPVPQDQMDIDKYDDYVRGPVRDVITVDTKIKSTNKGFEMLSKLGWVEGQPLGLSQDGMFFRSIVQLHRSCTVRVARVDPIPFHIKNDATGLGKTSQDFRMIETTVSQRRELDSERQRNETEEQRKAREVSMTDTYRIQLITHYSYYSGKCRTSCRPADRDIGGSPTILLHGLRQAIPKCRPIRRAH